MKKTFASVLGIALCLPLLSFAQTTTESTGSVTTTAPTAITTKEAKKDMLSKLKDEMKKVRDTKVKNENKELTTVQLSCLKSATTKREDSVIAAMNAFHSAMITAMTARKTALESVWSMPKSSDRSVARETLHTVYKNSMTLAHKNLKVARDGAWTSFKTESKSCGVNNSREINTEKPEESSTPTMGL